MSNLSTQIQIKRMCEPVLRFKEFNIEWEVKRVDQILKRYSSPVDVVKDKLYQQIGIKSHGKGIFHKELIRGKILGNKRVFWIKKDLFVVNIVFAWEHAISITTESEEGMIASHRFPMYGSVGDAVDTNFILKYFLRNRGKYLLGLASPGGAGRNKTLGQQTFNELKITLPKLKEQQKINSFLSAVDNKIQQLTKKRSLIVQYKKEVMRQLFTEQLRFKDENSNHFSNWSHRKLEELCLKSQSGGTPKSTVKEYYEGDIPFLSIRDMTKQGKYLNYTSKKVSQKGINSSSTWVVPKKSLIYSMYASVGLVSINEIEMATSQAVMNMIINEGEEIEFIYYYLQYFRSKLYKYIETGTQGNINASIVKSIEIPYPNI